MDIEIPDYVAYRVLTKDTKGMFTVSGVICFKCALTEAQAGRHIITETLAKGDHSLSYCEVCGLRMYY